MENFRSRNCAQCLRSDFFLDDASHERPFPSALPFRRIRVTHTHTHIHAMKNREYFFYVYLVLETKINDSFSLAPDSPPPSPVPCPGELPRERRFQKLGYIRRTTVVYETSFYPRVTNHTGEKLCVHEIKVMYSVCRDGSIRNKSRNGVGDRTFVYRVWGERNFKKSSRVCICANVGGGGRWWIRVRIRRKLIEDRESYRVHARGNVNRDED